MTKKLPTDTGSEAEQFAKDFLKDLGYIFIESNFHSKFGEIDLIFIDQKTLVFVEVKKRKAHSMVGPLESITDSKLSKIKITAKYYLQTHKNLPQKARIDAIGITTYPDHEDIEHLQNISQF